MADFIQKSDRNEEAVPLLNQSAFFDQAIHCSYYACLQYIMYFNQNKGIDETSTKHAVSESKKKGQGSNAAYIAMMLQYVSHKAPRDFKNISRNINKLKVLRTNADYSERMLTMSESEEAVRLAKIVKSELKEIIRT
jgi:hypothetical protein